MSRIVNNMQDVMQVCRRGHVITDLLRSCPERSLTHCDRCGAVTLERCPTCGRELPGALIVPGLQPIGARQPPAYCATCGAAFPWTKQRQRPKTEALAVLENILERLPQVIRQLRVRHGDRPPFRVADEKDLEDLLRSLLPLHFDDIRPECRTPSYAAGTRTDFLLAADRIAIAIKLAQPRILEQLPEDAAYYRRERKCRTLVAFIYDPEASLREPCAPLAASAEDGEEPEVRCVIGSL
ncbi:MAG TPA: DUF2321 domain-containing protein [Gemmataceae bacterium]|jgi:hypothetical protein